ncbi:hypothetical protein P3T37_003487 [Kitasatospora sp. MAA4]|uniref:hypothetical protein n=1 Tax=Kitasatospora sp. MAA4 TaxID=3035093 RepID=UPI002476D3FB|nr:hypothetical protein [Kitasatospora sp. MAA4]MDH6134085.1 hypothetical protein [Kitasatospora sp. MAA4]
MSDLPPGLEPEPLGVPVRATGHPPVDAALARLAAVDGVPTTEHAAVYEDVHRSLTDALSALDRPEDEP